MQKQFQEIPGRLRELREILEISPDTMAEKLSVSIEEYLHYEDGTKDIPISILFEAATVLGVDLTVLLSGETPKMHKYSVVRKGDGINVQRYEGYSYESLAYNFIGRTMEPLLVTICPEDKPPLVTHPGQEFNYCISGKMKVVIGTKEHLLSPGDSIYFDPQVPHGQSAVGGKTEFLTVILD